MKETTERTEANLNPDMIGSVVMELIQFETVPIITGSGTTIGETVDKIVQDAINQGQRIKSFTVHCPPAWWKDKD